MCGNDVRGQRFLLVSKALVLVTCKNTDLHNCSIHGAVQEIRMWNKRLALPP